MRRYRAARRSRSPLNAVVGVGLVVAFAYASHGHFPLSHGSPGQASAAGSSGQVSTVAGAGLPDGSGYSRASWARALLAAGGWPVTGCNVGAVQAWEKAENSNPAWFNPLDTTQREPGSSPVNSVGVQAYSSWRDGFAATLATLHNGRYPAVLAALAAGSNAQAVADAVAASPWGTQPFRVGCAA